MLLGLPQRSAPHWLSQLGARSQLSLLVWKVGQNRIRQANRSKNFTDVQHMFPEGQTLLPYYS